MPSLLATSRRMRRSTYGREIIAVLCLKLFGLAALYYLFFSPAHQFAPTPQDVAQHLVDNAKAATAGR